MSGERKATPLHDALAGYLERAGLAQRLDQASVVAEWPSLVGPRIAEVTTPVSVTLDGTLFVRVRSAPWAQELQLMSPTILAELAKRGKTIRRIIWRAGGE